MQELEQKTRRRRERIQISSIVCFSICIIGILGFFEINLVKDVEVMIGEIEVAPTIKPVTNKMNLNNASYDELCMVSGIGDVLAKRILKDRDERGGYTMMDELSEVYGIGEKTIENIKELFYIPFYSEDVEYE